MQDHRDGRPPAKARSAGAAFMAIVASVLVAIPVVFEVRKLATQCQSPHAGPPWWVRQHPCTVEPYQVAGAIEICLLVVGVAAIGGGIGWLVAVGRHRPRRWPSVATGVFVAVSALYTGALFLAVYFSLIGLGRFGW